MKKYFFLLLFCCSCLAKSYAQNNDFAVRGFHLDLRIQVMPMPALKSFAKKLSENGINTLIMEWEGTYPFEKHPLIPNRYAYTKAEIVGFIKYCNTLGIDVIPLQQSFGHVEYILRNSKYKDLREDQKDYSQVCPLQITQDSLLFSDLYKELASTHTSKYIHIGGDETYLLGHDERCRKRVAEVGKSRLYIDYIRMLCNIVIRLGKQPVMWADIALKYPEAISLLPKGTILVDWNYGWDMDNFGEHKKLVESGLEIWGAPAIRSYPDNYFLTMWDKHFKNISEFVPACRQLGYKGMVMTSWSTSGGYSAVMETEDNILDLYAIRHVYPISGFNMLLAAYTESLKSAKPIAIDTFVTNYAKSQYGFNQEQALQFWKALTTTPLQVVQGKVSTDGQLAVAHLLDSATLAMTILNKLKPVANIMEFEHYRLMNAIRVNYLTYEKIEAEINSPDFFQAKISDILVRLKVLMNKQALVDEKFNYLNAAFLYPGQLAEEQNLRDSKSHLLFNRLSRKK